MVRVHVYSVKQYQAELSSQSHNILWSAPAIARFAKDIQANIASLSAGEAPISSIVTFFLPFAASNMKTRLKGEYAYVWVATLQNIRCTEHACSYCASRNTSRVITKITSEVHPARSQSSYPIFIRFGIHIHNGCHVKKEEKNNQI